MTEWLRETALDRRAPVQVFSLPMTNNSGKLRPPVCLTSSKNWYRTSWYGTVPAGMVLYQLAWYCTSWHGTVPAGMVLYQLAWYCTSWHGTVPAGMVLYQLAWYCTSWHGTVPAGMVLYQLAIWHYGWPGWGTVCNDTTQSHPGELLVAAKVEWSNHWQFQRFGEGELLTHNPNY